MINNEFNIEQINGFLNLLSHDLYEVRAFPTGEKNKTRLFPSEKRDRMLKYVESLNGVPAIYVNLHRPKTNVKGSVSDEDISHFTFFPIDLDSKREDKKSNASMSEIKVLAKKSDNLYDWFVENGVNPIRAFSGNGWHLLIPIYALENSEENAARFKALGDQFVKAWDADSTVYNASRIWKLYGTMVRKGPEVPEEERIHRRSEILLDDYKQHYSFDLLERLARSMSVPVEDEKPSANEFERRLKDSGIEVLETKDISDKRNTKFKYTIKCPLCGNDDGADIFETHYTSRAPKYGFKCHHDSCEGKRFSDLELGKEIDTERKQTIIKERGSGTGFDPNLPESYEGMPLIAKTKPDADGNIQQRLNKDIASDAFKVLVSQDPRNELIFVAEQGFGRLNYRTERKRIDEGYYLEDTQYKFKAIDRFAMRDILDQCMVFGLKKEKYDKILQMAYYTLEIETSSPQRVADSICTMGDHTKLPYLKGILGRPLIDQTFNLIDEPGYHVDSQFYLDGSKLPKVEIMSIVEAYDTIADWFEDFDFTSAADIANTISLALTLMLRNSLSYGAMPPLFIVTSNNPGSGKSTLCNLIGIIATGKVAGATNISDSEEELRKHMLSEAVSGTEFIVFDNAKLNNTIDCSAIASAVTETRIRGRLMATNTIADVENNITVCFNGNRIQASPELVDRAVFISLQSQERAADREFKMDTIIADTLKNRDKLYSAFYSFIHHWKEAGCPMLEKSKHRQKQWHKVVGGIQLFVAQEYSKITEGGPMPQISAIGENYADFKRRSDPEYMMMSELGHVILQDVESKELDAVWNSEDIIHLASYRDPYYDGESAVRFDGDLNILGDKVDAAREASRKKKVTKFIDSRCNTTYGGDGNLFEFRRADRKKDRLVAFEIVKIVKAQLEKPPF